MFLDASIIVAILGKETDWEEQLAKVRAAETLYFSAVTRYEATLALARIYQMAKGGRTDPRAIIETESAFDSFIEDIAAEEIAISSAIGRGAVVAAQIFGKVAGHKAALNLGDCFSYAAAKSLGTGLLYKGNDFVFTDLG